MALEFAGSGHRVCLIEAGSLEYDSETQDLYRGEIVGHQYEPLDITRLRFFGGTTNHWAGYCSPIRAYSFERQPWIPHSGWPIGLSDLMPYYERAIDVLGLERSGWERPGGWQAAVVGDAFGDQDFATDDEVFADRAFLIDAVRMGEEFRAPLSGAANLDIVLNANLTEILVTDTARQVTGLQVESLTGRRQVVRGRYYVLAMGGIENPRLLLASSGVQKEGLGNGLVGRFFSDHAEIDAIQLLLAERGTLARYERGDFGSAEAIIYKDLSYAAQQAHELTSGMVQIDPIGGGGVPGVDSLKHLLSSGRQRQMPDELGHHLKEIIANIGPIVSFTAETAWHGAPLTDLANMRVHLDPAPNPDSRVLLGQDRDALGVPRVKLDWQLTDLDRRTFRWMVENIASHAGATGLGRVHVDFDWQDIDEMIYLHYHNIGTTRMAADPREGVVDADCRVHGVENLYVAGSSVFSTSGAGSPTFAIVALAIRLADHLKTRLSA